MDKKLFPGIIVNNKLYLCREYEKVDTNNSCCVPSIPMDYNIGIEGRVLFYLDNSRGVIYFPFKRSR